MMIYQLYNQDCLEWMKAQPGESIDICVSSPPYNIGIAYNTYGDKMSQTEYLSWQKSIWDETCRIMKPTGHLFLNIAPTRKDPLLPYRIASQIPWTIQNSIVWSKCIEIDGYVRGHGVVTSSQTYLPNGHEMIFHFTQKGRTNIDVKLSSVPYQPEWAVDNERRTGRNWRPTVNNWHIPYETCGSWGGNRSLRLKGEKKHPAIFPRDLVRHCLNVAGARPGQQVFDPFAGTGTTLVVAKEMGIDSVGCEIDPDYCQFIHQRMQ
jgi:site-specific DNA-methyltransferase (adenine-specific)